MQIELAKRIQQLPPYLFAHIDTLKAEVRAQGVDLIDLAEGDPDIPTPQLIIDALDKALADPAHHRYPSYKGMIEFREAVAGWYKQRFDVALNPETEVLSLIGSKEGIAHLPFAFLNPGDISLIPDPGYPVYKASTILTGGIPHFLPLLKENQFLPDLESIPAEVLKKAKILYLNYPNNPTSALASEEFFKEVVRFANRHQVLVCHDAAYTEVAYDNYQAPSFLQTEGAKEVGAEFHSLSKTFSMTGWRVGFAVGNARVVEGLGKVKTNIDSGLFQAIQMAGIAAMKEDENLKAPLRAIYQERRDLLAKELREMGLKFEPPKATFYFWISVPENFDSTSFSLHLLKKAGIVATPGNGFGPTGEGFFRISMTAPTLRLQEAVDRLKQVGW